MSSAAQRKRIAVLGPKGSFSHIAGMRYAAAAGLKNPKYVFFDDFQLIDDALHSDGADVGIYPAFNMLGGPVPGSRKIFSRLLKESLPIDGTHEEKDIVISIEGTINLKIELAAMGIEDTTLDQIESSYSHPHANKQFVDFAQEMEWNQLEKTSTAAAAQFVSKSKDPTIAAVASPEAAKIYKLKILKENIQKRIEGEPDNHTIFVVAVPKKKEHTAKLAHESVTDKLPQSKKDPYNQRIVIGFEVQDKPGSLKEALTAFAEEKVNIPYIQSYYDPSLKMNYIVCELDKKTSQRQLDKVGYRFLDQGRSWQIMPTMSEKKHLKKDTEANVSKHAADLRIKMKNKPGYLLNVLNIVKQNIPYIQTVHNENRELTYISCGFDETTPVAELLDTAKELTTKGHEVSVWQRIDQPLNACKIVN